MSGYHYGMHMLSLAASPQVQKATSASLALELLTIRRMFNLNLSLSLSLIFSLYVFLCLSGFLSAIPGHDSHNSDAQSRMQWYNIFTSAHDGRIP